MGENLGFLFYFIWNYSVPCKDPGSLLTMESSRVFFRGCHVCQRGALKFAERTERSSERKKTRALNGKFSYLKVKIDGTDTKR